MLSNNNEYTFNVLIIPITKRDAFRGVITSKTFKVNIDEVILFPQQIAANYSRNSEVYSQNDSFRQKISNETVSQLMELQVF